MGGFFGVASKESCIFDLFFGIDYHSHLGTRRAGIATYGKDGFKRSIHNIENTPFRTKFDKELPELEGKYGIGCISDYEAQPIFPMKEDVAISNKMSVKVDPYSFTLYTISF